MQVIAHRGSSQRCPENTLAAFRAALEDGADGIEFDVQSSQDGRLVIFHDDTLERTTDGHGLLTDKTFDALRRLDAGNGERIPTFSEVLAVSGNHLLLDIEIKQPGVEHRVMQALAEHPDARWFISSFEWDSLRICRDLAATADLWPLAEEFTTEIYSVAEEIGAVGVALDWPLITAERMHECARRNLRVAAWTVNEAEVARTLHDLGVSTLISDDPRGIREALAG